MEVELDAAQEPGASEDDHHYARETLSPVAQEGNVPGEGADKDLGEADNSAARGGVVRGGGMRSTREGETTSTVVPRRGHERAERQSVHPSTTTDTSKTVEGSAKETGTDRRGVGVHQAAGEGGQRTLAKMDTPAVTGRHQDADPRPDGCAPHQHLPPSQSKAHHSSATGMTSRDVRAGHDTSSGEDSDESALQQQLRAVEVQRQVVSGATRQPHCEPVCTPKSATA
jgi:hypothetical protein